MPILLYCVAEASAPLNCPATGVGGLAVCRIEHSGLVVFVSGEFDAGLTQSSARESALQFHRVLRQLFESAAILPFRFPTVLPGDAEVKDHMDSSARRYQQLLEKYRASVQIEVVVNWPEQPGVPRAASGTEYLRVRKSRLDELSHLASSLQSAAGSAIKEWRVRTSPDAVRWFACLERDSVDQFNETMRTVKLPAGYTARVSGPWPVSEFLDSST
jgi:hypothetical protein